jgi:hypothetical protein
MLPGRQAVVQSGYLYEFGCATCMSSIDPSDKLQTTGSMPRFSNNLTRLHGYVAGGLLAVFMALTLFFCLMGWKPNPGAGRIAAATLATLAGPFTGAIARPDEPFCWTTARSLLPTSAGFLLMAALCQVLPLPFRRGALAFRVVAWIIGLVVWFGASIISLLNAID